MKLIPRILPFFKKPTLSWGVKISTAIPSCIYYFGPFDTFREAQLAQDGYIDDLVEEKAQGITVEIKRCQPVEMTIFEDEAKVDP
ncbi:DUF1816 domain-containing protein [Myxosarcina sp. GI1]|uniref:DUF1816 domain-containing protein n=1 Tax=Myxosarcina sp. GI1 TaxID=1541065 RepID=UPI000563A6AF|nr:DUF1816 domain-containing protein [Myxosarcina sp. GI1]